MISTSVPLCRLSLDSCVVDYEVSKDAWKWFLQSLLITCYIVKNLEMIGFQSQVVCFLVQPLPSSCLRKISLRYFQMIHFSQKCSSPSYWFLILLLYAKNIDSLATCCSPIVSLSGYLPSSYFIILQ